jgi:sulfite reductase (NADPH) hemoprotein beta-component
VVTANRLGDGLVVFLGAGGTWVEDIERAIVAVTKEAADALLRQGVEAEIANKVVGPYLIEVGGAEGAIVPLHIRELMRTKGPSVRPDLGKQAAARPH